MAWTRFRGGLTRRTHGYIHGRKPTTGVTPMLRMKSVAGAALFAALSLTVAPARSNPSSSPSRQKFDHKLKIESWYTESADTTGVSLRLKQPNSLTRLARGGAPSVSAPTRFGD